MTNQTKTWKDVFIDHGLFYARMGLLLVPTHGKRPLLKGWQDKATVDRSKIKETWGVHDPPNMAVLLGPRSNVIDMECDSEEGEEHLLELFGGTVPPCPTYQSNRGKHRLFSFPDNLPEWAAEKAVIKLKRNGQESGIELRLGGSPALSVLPPSRHPLGMRYRWQPDLRIDKVPLPQLSPEVLKTMLASVAPATQGRVSSPGIRSEVTKSCIRPLEGFPEGQRHVGLTKYAGKFLRNCDIESEQDLEKMKAALHIAAQTCSPPTPKEEVEGIWSDILAKERRRRQSCPVRESVDDPHRLAKRFIEQSEAMPLAQYLGEIQRWDNGVYRPLADALLKSEINSTIKREYDEEFRRQTVAAKKNEHLPSPRSARHVTPAKVDAVLAAVRASKCIPESQFEPSWIGPGSPRFEAKDCIFTPQKVIHWRGLIKGEKSAFVNANPGYFNLSTLGCEWNRTAEVSSRWLGFLQTSFGRKSEQVQLLRQWMGYVLTRDTSFQKILLLYGPPRSGKGTICRVITALLGEPNVVAPTAGSLNERFGLAQLIGKTLAILPDTRVSSRQDQSTLIQTLLAISGEDKVTIDRKHRNPITTHLSTRIMIQSNEIPRLTDASPALASRFLVLQTKNSCLGNEDLDLAKQLTSPDELPGILNWALLGLAELHRERRFIETKTSKRRQEEIALLGNPVRQFVQDRCVIGPADAVPTSSLYEAWRLWCTTNGIQPITSHSEFGRSLHAAYPEIVTSQKRVGGGRQRVYQGISLAN